MVQLLFTGNHLRTWRESRGLSQAETGTVLGVQRETISSWERKDEPLDERVGIGVRYYSDHPDQLAALIPHAKEPTEPRMYVVDGYTDSGGERQVSFVVIATSLMEALNLAREHEAAAGLKMFALNIAIYAPVAPPSRVLGAMGVVWPAQDAVLSSQGEVTSRVFPKYSRELFPGVLVCTIDDRTGEDREVSLVGEASMWIKLSPRVISRRWEPADLHDLIRGNLSNVIPLYAPSSGDLDYGRNMHGAAIWLVDQRDPATTTSAVQIYDDGEMWATNTYLLSHGRHSSDGTGVKHIMMNALEDAFEDALPKYLAFARNSLKLDLPLTVSIGLTGIQDFRLAARGIAPHDRSARILGPGVSDSFSLDEKALDIAARSVKPILLPFFRKIWRAAGKTRPE